MACARLGFDPFDESEARLPRAIAMEYLNKYSPANDTLSRRPRLEDRGLQLYAEGKTRREISTLNLEESLGSFFQLLQPESFLAVLVFLPQTPRVLAAFQASGQNSPKSWRFQCSWPTVRIHSTTTAICIAKDCRTDSSW